MPDIINQAQGAFMKGRSIVRNVSVAQQLMTGYGRRHISERIAWKIDLRKAYDTVSWDFLDSMLHELKFPLKFISWVRMCVRSSSFSILINGEMVNYFDGKRGLRQGDPISPFLFLIAMEYLSRLLNRLDREAEFYFHPKCHRIDLKHILFADDLFLFSSERSSSIIAMKDCVERFLRAFGLSINLAKSQVFPVGMPDSKKVWVEQVLGIAVAKLPVRYLGIPLNSRAGRRMCILPKKVVHTVSSICARFLWKGNATGKGGFLVSWKEDADSVWRAWTRAYWTKGKEWWEAENASKTTWIIKDLEDCKKLSTKCISIHQNRLVWKGAGDGFTVRDTYDTLVTHSDKVEWHKLVWNRFNSPRSALHLWLVAKNRLLTRDRMRGMCYTGDGSCVLCRSAQESRDHLFFECPFAKQLIRISASFLKLRWIPIEWHLLIP
ncbi:hypothetical protein QQ045_005640 [Rhodiola kirilowii]